jgi:hypothetical protein
LSELNLTTDLADAYIASATTWNAKQNAITLTTTGNNGASTFVSNTLNIPTYTLAGLGGINLTSLSATSPLLYDNTTGVFSIQQSSGSQAGFLSAADWTTFNNKVPSTRTLSINGTTYDLSADRSWTITPNVNATNTQDYTATAAQTTFTVTGGYTVGQLAVFYNGSKLASNEFTATNGTTFVLATACQANDIVQAVVAVTGGGIGGSGTANTIAKWTASGVLGNSLIFDNGTQVGIGTNSILSGATLEVYNATQGNLFISSSGTNESCLRFFSGGNELVTLRSTGTGALRIETGTGSPAERLRITNTGLVGIGTNNPLALLDVCVLSSGARRLLVNYADSIVTIKGANDSNNGENLRLVGDNLFFNTGSSGNGTEKMRLTASGRLAIGRTSPGTALSVAGQSEQWQLALSTDTGSGAVIGSPSANVLAFGDWSGAEKMRIDSTRVLIGQTSASIATNGWNLQTDGGGHASFAISNNEAFIYNNRNTGTTYEIDFRTNSIERGKISVTDSGVSYITTPSDLNLKKNFEVWDEKVLDIFKNLNPQKFNFAVQEDDQLKTKGFIAQELVDYFPEAYPKSKERYFFNPSGMVVYLMKAVQELTKEIDELKQLVK